VVKSRTESEFTKVDLQALQRTSELRRRVITILVLFTFREVTGADEHVSLIRREQGGYG